MQPHPKDGGKFASGLPLNLVLGGLLDDIRGVNEGTVKPWNRTSPRVERKVCWGSNYHGYGGWGQNGRKVSGFCDSQQEGAFGLIQAVLLG